MIFDGQQISEDELSKIIDTHLQVRNSLKKIQIEDLWGLELDVFTKFCYTTFSPNEAGSKIVKYLANRLKFHEIPANLCKGDFFLNYKKPLEVKYIEMKCSLLNKNGYFGIRNIRPWHEIDFYLIAFTPDVNSSPNLYLVKLQDLLSKYTVTYMNGTSQENKDNKNSGVGMAIANNEENLRFLSSINLLGGTSFYDFINYLEKYTYLPYGFNELETKLKKQVVVQDFITPKEEIFEEVKKTHKMTNLGGFRVGEFYFTKNNFTQNYVKFISQTLLQHGLHGGREIYKILGKNVVTDVNSFPPSTLARPSTMHKINRFYYLTTNNSSSQKMDIIIKIAEHLKQPHEFYSYSELESNLIRTAA